MYPHIYVFRKTIITERNIRTFQAGHPTLFHKHQNFDIPPRSTTMYFVPDLAILKSTPLSFSVGRY